MKFQIAFCLSACFITVTASSQVPNTQPNPMQPVPASSGAATDPILRFGRTEMQLFELISICSGPNLDYSVDDEEYKQLQLAAQYRLALIQAEPDLAAILVDHVDRMIEGSSMMPSSLTGIFRALALRPDVDLEAVRRYALLASDVQDQADQYKTKPFPPEKAALLTSIRYGLPDLLGAYPTREGEDYLIKILEHAVVPFEFPLTYKMPVVRAAAKSGAERCLPGLEQTLNEYESAHEAQMKLGNNGYGEDINEVRDCVNKLRERVALQNVSGLDNQAQRRPTSVETGSTGRANLGHSVNYLQLIGMSLAGILIAAFSYKRYLMNK